MGRISEHKWGVVKIIQTHGPHPREVTPPYPQQAVVFRAWSHTTLGPHSYCAPHEPVRPGPRYQTSRHLVHPSPRLL